MIQRIQKWKKQDGFTLVEIIVVLVILAILAAFTIPAMLGFVNEAKGKASIAQAREAYVAAQSATSDVAANITLADETGTAVKTDTIADGDTITTKIAKRTYAMVKEDYNATVTVNIGSDPAAPTTAYAVTVHVGKDGKVVKVQFVDANAKYRVTITTNASGSGTSEIEKLP